MKLVSLVLMKSKDQLMQNAAQSMQLTLSGTDAKREYLADGHDDTELFVQMREAPVEDPTLVSPFFRNLTGPRKHDSHREA